MSDLSQDTGMQSMDEGLLEIREHEGEGYKALIDSGGWTVAILRYQDGLLPGQQSSMERHLETDEVFVLTKGDGTIVLGGNGQKPEQLTFQGMEIGTIYNIRRCAWHTLSLSQDAAVLIVENQGTGRHNSEYGQLTAEQRQLIAERARVPDRA